MLYTVPESTHESGHITSIEPVQAKKLQSIKVTLCSIFTCKSISLCFVRHLLYYQTRRWTV